MIGFLAAPAIGAVAGSLIFNAWSLIVDVPHRLNVGAIINVALWGQLFAYLPTIVLGIPLYLLMRRLRWTGLLPFLIGSFVLGVSPFWALRGFEADLSLFGVIVGGGGGVSAGLAFWLIVRPDRRSSPSPRNTSRGALP